MSSLSAKSSLQRWSKSSGAGAWSSSLAGGPVGHSSPCGSTAALPTGCVCEGRPRWSRLFLLKADQTPSPFAGEFVLEETGGSAPQIRYHDNTDGQAALTVVDGVVRLHPVVPITPTRAVSLTPLPAQTLPDARPKTMGNVLSMKNGQAWVGWQSNAITYPAYRLSELTYDLAGNVLTNEGTVDLSAPVHAVATLGDYTVAASRAEVVVIAPSCR